MSLQIGRYPSGLLDFLGSKNRGQTPSQAEDLVRFTSDISPYYLQNKRQLLSASTSPINLTGGWGAANLGPGRGQIAYVWGVGAASGALPAGTTYKLGMTYTAIDEGISVVLPVPIQTFTATERVAIGGPQGWWMYPRSQMGLYASAVTLGTATAVILYLDCSIIDL